jgi:formylglycine-generating enzyme required for sulfatase activity
VSAQIFISHASQDRRTAERICAELERRSLPCWISIRDIQPGEAFADAIVKAIDQACVMVLVFSTHANSSGEVLKELALASQRRLVVIPVRIEDVMPTRAFTYELATRQWLDLLDDWDRGIEQLAERIVSVSRSGAAEAPTNSKVRPRRMFSARIWASIAGGAALAATAMAAWFWLAESRPGRAFRDCPECPEMIVVPAGSFVMGTPESEPGREPHEGPQRTVKVRPFAIGKYEVTFGQWDLCVAERACPPPGLDPYFPGRDRHAVTSVSWIGAQRYVDWLVKRTGKRYRLPSEAEWEYAARAGTTTAHYWGAEVGQGNTNCDGCGSRGDKTSAEIGSFPPSPFGLHDMLGNVSELVQDCWAPDYTAAPVDGSPRRDAECDNRIWRGGNYSDPASRVRAGSREPIPPRQMSMAAGFRVARSVD